MYEKIKNFSETKFKRKTGISRVLFEILVQVIKIALKEKHKNGGRLPKLTVENMLLMFLTYYRDYSTYLSLEVQFGLNESNAHRRIKWIEEVLLKAFRNNETDFNFGTLINIGKASGNKGNIQIVDVTECTIQRAKSIEVQRMYYSGKKKKHTIKIQIMIEENTNRILSIAFEKGSIHDFKVLKETSKDMDQEKETMGDSGYTGLDKLFNKATTPKKKSKNKSLTEEDKEFNRLISNIRIPIEHVNCQVKIFRILSERFRSRIKRFFAPAVLICEFYNICL